MALDDEDKKAIATMIAEQLKTSAKATEQTIAKALAGLDLDKRLETLKTDLAPKEPEPKEPDPEPKKGGGVADDPEFKRLKAELEQQRKATEAQARRAEEEAKARQAEALTNGVSQALTAAGADPKRVGMALAYLREKGTVKLDDKGAPAFAFTREWGPEMVPADKGAAEWLGTEDGKFFVAPTNTNGTGDGAGRPAGGSGGGSADPMAILNQALAATWGG